MSARDALVDFVRELAGQAEVDAVSLREEGAGERQAQRHARTRTRFSLEDVASLIETGGPRVDARVRILERHHEHCGGGPAYSPGSAIVDMLATIEGQPMGILEVWIEQAQREMGEGER